MMQTAGLRITIRKRFSKPALRLPTALKCYPQATECSRFG